MGKGGKKEKFGRRREKLNRNEQGKPSDEVLRGGEGKNAEGKRPKVPKEAAVRESRR